MSSFLKTLQDRWHLQSVKQVLIILLVFACTGSSVVLLKHAFGISNQSPSNVRLTFYIAVLPIYNVLLLGYGFLFGQFKFFFEFEKRFFSRLNPFKKKSK
jgi:hypothetical protein